MELKVGGSWLALMGWALWDSPKGPQPLRSLSLCWGQSWAKECISRSVQGRKWFSQSHRARKTHERYKEAVFLSGTSVTRSVCGYQAQRE